jgi:hypothetical protein
MTGRGAPHQIDVRQASRLKASAGSYAPSHRDARQAASSRNADCRGTPAQHHSRHAAVLLYGGVAVSVIALHLATNGTLGFHTDELYYLDCGRHPALGYVDFPPVVPLLARLETALLGVTPWTLRLLPSLLSGVLVALCGAYVRRLGGSLWLQGIALIAGIAAPYIVGSGDVFQTVIFDVATWMVALYWFLWVVIDRRPRYWIYLGITLGIGLEVKYTIVGLIAGITIAVLLTPSLRKELRTRYPWIAAAIALLIWASNLAWQVVNGFPPSRMSPTTKARTVASGFTSSSSASMSPCFFPCGSRA